ncbi:MAG TPA: alanyl-tRNA editing protein [Longimicrobiales bacterium]|nr:alanyl-tRNA editing protein [Longimicrobiales bacterium]
MTLHIPAFERDPRLSRLETEVVSAGEDRGRPFVVLADTVFYPEGGGQPADHGTVGGVGVVDVQKAEGEAAGKEIRHFLDAPAPSGSVTLELDWTRRFDHMQQHTAQHLLTAVADRRFGWHTTAFHLGPHVSDIEVDAPDLRADDLAELEEAVAAEIRAARPVTTRRVTHEEYARLQVRSRGLPAGHTGSVRLVEIEGIDLNTCGGTHCGSTSELEALKLLETEAMRGGTRLFYAAGGRLRRLHGAHHERNAQLRTLLGTSDDTLVAGVEGKLEQLKDAQRAIRALEEELAAAAAALLVAGPGQILVAHWDRRDLPFLQRVAREVARLAPDRVVFLTSGQGEEGAFLLGAGEGATVDLASAGPEVAEVLGGRGGGSAGIFQGKATRLSRRAGAVALLERKR